MRLFEIETIDVVKNPTVASTEIPLNKPGGFTVVILNDNVTPAEVVVEAIMYATGFSEAEAWKRMTAAHKGGWTPIAAYSSYDIAESVADKIMRHAQQNSNYDHYRRISRFNGPWPLTAEVMDSSQ